MLHTECAKKRKANCIQHMHFHELASHFYDLLIFVHIFHSACNEIEQFKRLTQEKGSKKEQHLPCHSGDAYLVVFLQ